MTEEVNDIDVSKEVAFVQALALIEYTYCNIKQIKTFHSVKMSLEKVRELNRKLGECNSDYRWMPSKFVPLWKKYNDSP